MLYTGKLDLNLENCIEIYRILDFLNLSQDTGSDDDADDVGGREFLADDVHNFIDRNLTKLSEIQFDKIRRYGLQNKFWKSIYEILHKADPVKFDKVSDENSLSINVMRIDSVPGHSEKFKILKTEKLEKFMQDYCDRKVLVRNNTYFYFHGTKITDNQTPNELFMKENDQIFITSVVQRNAPGNQRDRDIRRLEPNILGPVLDGNPPGPNLWNGLPNNNEHRDRPRRVNYPDRRAINPPNQDGFYERMHQQMLRIRDLNRPPLPQPAARNEAPRERENHHIPN